MKLDKNQIAIIDRVLEKLGVVYIDYKYEILDHIATQVEEKMATDKIDFEEAFPVVLKKWQPKLRKSSSTWFGYFWEMPEILLQKCLKIYKRKLLIVSIGSLILTAIVLLFSPFLKHHLALFFDILSVFYSSTILLSILGYIKIRMSKNKTSYGFLYKQQFMACLMISLQQLYYMNSGFEKNDFSGLFSYFIIFTIAMVFLIHFLNIEYYKSHFSQLEKMDPIKA